MFYNNTENIILFLANNNSEKAIIEYLNNRNTCFSENELQIASKLLFHKSPEIRYNFIKFIGRVKDYNLTTNLSAVINNENEKYYIQLEAISTLMKLSEKDEKIKLILKKAVTKLSSHHWQNKYIAKNVLTKDVFDIFIKSITEILQTLKIEITNHSMHQTKKLQLKNSLAISSYIFGDLNGSLVFNFDLTTAQTLLKKMYELNILKNGMIVNNQSLTKIFFELSILTNTFNKQISVNCQKLHNINLECMPAYFFNRQNIILSEKEDDTYLLKLQTNIGEINFGMIKHSNDTVINDFNEIAEFLKVDLVSANKIQIKCKTINFSIEGINIDNPLIMEHKIMVTKDIFQKIMNYYHIMLSECQTDKKTISQLNYKTKFLTSLCDELDFYIQNFIFFKLGQINIELKNKVFENITTYKHLLKYPADLVQTILNKLAYNELLAIIQHSNNTISSKILLSCSEKMRQTINNSLSQQSLFHSAFIFDAKYKLGKLIKEFCDSDEHYQSSIKNLLASISEL